jgi:Fe-S oxidoreductase
MLTPIEKILFTLLALGSLVLALRAADRIRRIVKRGRGSEHFQLTHVVRRAWDAAFKAISLSPTWRVRFWPSLFHALVVWGFTYYLLVNIGDGLQGFIPGFVFLGEGAVGEVYRLMADLLSVGVLAGMAALLVRRFLVRTPAFKFRNATTLHPKVKAGRVRRDSAIVGGFILFHVGSRFLGESTHLTEKGVDLWQPFASAASFLWDSLSPADLTVMQHVFFWGALGSILVFVPYFLYSKHIHIFMVPLNFLLQPERKSMGQLEKINFDDEALTQYGATRLEHLEWKALVDAYACIMCNRCQDACPAHTTGKALSPAALEINKRYFLNEEGAALAAGQESSKSLTEFAIGLDEVWACTACGACVDICPVGNEPMRDILDIRRGLVLMENSFPAQFQTAYKGMERQGNPWNIGPAQRLEWAQGLTVPTVEQNPGFEILYWVGCAPATDPRARQTARAFVKILLAGGVNFAVLGQMESCTGDSARRSGNEALFFQLASQNTEAVNEVMGNAEEPPKRRIVTTCPHCLHTLKNEYPDFGGHWDVIHHTQLINELTGGGKLRFDSKKLEVAYHDPCYLGRHNGVFEAPREALKSAGAAVAELGRNHRQSFCCGAGGAQMWKEEEHGEERVSVNRLREAQATGKDTLAVGCPFCMIMLSDAATTTKSELTVRDVAEIVAESLSTD